TLGFGNIPDWPRLAFTTTITTVSRFMKQLMWSRGVDPMVIANGIPERWLTPPDAGLVQRLAVAFADRMLLAKIGRFDPDKRWLMAVDAVAELKRAGHRPTLLVKGGIEPHGLEVFQRARELGLEVRDVTAADRSPSTGALALAEASEADVL